MDPENFPSTFINKLPNINGLHYYISRTYWRFDEIRLEIADTFNSNEWVGNISYDELKQSAEELEIPYDTFLNECKIALTTNGGVENFQYLVENDKFTLTKTDEFQIQYLEIEMLPKTELKNSLILTAVDLIASLRSELSDVKKETDDLKEKYQDMVGTLKKCLDEKDRIEKRLLRKFAVLLNSKKDKIAELQDLLVEKNEKLEQAGFSGMDSINKERTEVENNHNDSDEDFMQPTQVMTQPVPTVTLPKRKKFITSNDVGVLSSVTGLETRNVGISMGTQEKVSSETTIQDSPDIFDQL